MRTRLQEKFNLLDIDELNTLNSIASDKNKQICNNYIEIWRDNDLLHGYFGTKCNEIYRRRQVTNNAILELYIYYCFMMYELDCYKQEQAVFYDMANYYYKDGMRQAGGKEKDIPQRIFEDLMIQPCTNGYTLDEYRGAKALNSTYQIHRQAVGQIQRGKKPEVKEMDREIEKQENERLKVKDKISGVIDMFLIGICIDAMLEGAKEVIPPTKELQARFVAVMDDRTTKMCRSLNGQIFNVYGKNTFTRYSESAGGLKEFTCDGLVRGLNKPPISDHVHWCRSGLEIVK